MSTTSRDFADLGLSRDILENLDRLGYVEMTPIQARALPVMLRGEDLIGQAETGTGKTAAFGLALLSSIEPGGDLPGALVLCPTRELAAQVASELRRLARPLANTNVVTITGGTSFSRQRQSLEHGVDVVVGTPGRVLDHLEKKTLDLSRVKTFVLDEADRMLDMGFLDDVSAIARATPGERQTLLMSATINEEVRELSEQFQRQAVSVSTASGDTAPDITHLLYEIEGMERIEALRRVLAYHEPESAVIFCNQRDTTAEVAAALSAAGHSVGALHGGLEQHGRDDVLILFSNRSLRLLVATNVAARGIDVDELGAVINFELPRDPKEFVHRVGRTGRAGERGLAIGLIGDYDRPKIDKIGPPLSELPLRNVAELPRATETPAPAPTKTLVIRGGRKDKLRAGDIVGALTGELGLDGDAIGAITIGDRVAHVAIDRSVADKAAKRVNAGRIKGRSFRAHLLEP